MKHVLVKNVQAALAAGVEAVVATEVVAAGAEAVVAMVVAAEAEAEVVAATVVAVAAQEVVVAKNGNVMIAVKAATKVAVAAKSAGDLLLLDFEAEPGISGSAYFSLKSEGRKGNQAEGNFKNLEGCCRMIMTRLIKYLSYHCSSLIIQGN